MLISTKYKKFLSYRMPLLISCKPSDPLKIRINVFANFAIALMLHANESEVLRLHDGPYVKVKC